jgi:hypothetical protein
VNEGDERRHEDRGTYKHRKDLRTRPSVVVPDDESEDEQEEASRKGEETSDVQLRCTRVHLVHHAGRAEHERHGTDRHVYEEDPLPTECTGEHTPDERAHSDSATDCRTPYRYCRCPL